MSTQLRHARRGKASILNSHLRKAYHSGRHYRGLLRYHITLHTPNMRCTIRRYNHAWCWFVTGRGPMNGNAHTLTLQNTNITPSSTLAMMKRNLIGLCVRRLGSDTPISDCVWHRGRPGIESWGFDPHSHSRWSVSLGHLWEWCALYCHGSRHEAGKVMGLAAFGDPNQHADLEAISIDARGEVRIISQPFSADFNHQMCPAAT